MCTNDFYVTEKSPDEKLTGLTVAGIIQLIAKRDESNLSNVGTGKKAGKCQIHWGFRIPAGWLWRYRKIRTINRACILSKEDNNEKNELGNPFISY
jgi:hypothetical protein